MKKWIIINLFILLLSMSFTAQVPAPVHAEDGENESVADWLDGRNSEREKQGTASSVEMTGNAEKEAGTVGVTFGDVIRLIFSLLLVLGLLVLVLKWLQKKNGRITGSVVHPLGGASFGQNRSVQVVRIGRKLYILGVGEEVRLLKEIEDETEITEMLQSGGGEPDSKEEAGTIGRFIARLKSDFRPSPPKSSFKEQLEQQLQDFLKERRDSLDRTIGKGDDN